MTFKTQMLLDSVFEADMTRGDALNRLQDAAVVSDLCGSLEDIADADCLRAVEFIEAIPPLTGTHE